MGIGKNILQGARDLFGRSTKNETPSNLDIIQFNSTTNQWELVSGVIGSAVQTSSNVGAGEGVALSRVGDDLPFRTLVAGTGIILTGSATEIEIKSASLAKFVMGYHSDKGWKALDIRYGAMFTNKTDEAIEAEAQSIAGFAYTVKTITVFLTNNTCAFSSEITLKRNSVLIPATKITIPTLTTGVFVVSGLSEAFLFTDEMHEEHQQLGGGDNELKNTSYMLECES